MNTAATAINDGLYFIILGYINVSSAKYYAKHLVFTAQSTVAGPRKYMIVGNVTSN